MSNLSIFNFENHEIRFIDGKPVANDVARVLGYANPRDAVYKKVKPKNRTVCKTHTVDGKFREVFVLEEAGIYQLIFGSKLPSAELFQDWVFEEVLPTIRRTGSYSIHQPKSLEEQVPFWYKRLVLMKRHNRVQSGYFSMFEETIGLVATLEGHGYVLPDRLYPDISLGQHWANHLKSQGIHPNEIRQYYTHHFPDGRIVRASAYPLMFLSGFRIWFDGVYVTQKLPKYLAGKDKSSLPALEQMLNLDPGTLAINSK